MNRDEMIRTIEALYPIDSEYPETNAIGEKLLAQAKKECENWRNLPDNILQRYMELCIDEDNRSTRELLKKSKGWGLK